MALDLLLGNSSSISGIRCNKAGDCTAGSTQYINVSEHFASSLETGLDGAGVMSKGYILSLIKSSQALAETHIEKRVFEKRAFEYRDNREKKQWPILME
jgi:hypothetical protein